MVIINNLSNVLQTKLGNIIYVYLKSFHAFDISSVSLGVHGNATGSDSVGGIDHIRAVSDKVGGNDRSMHDRTIMRLTYYIHKKKIKMHVHIMDFFTHHRLVVWMF
jgi:hypothetical protein